MPTVEVRSQVSLDEWLNGVAQLDTPELEHFISQALTLRAKRIAPSLPKEEAKLLQKINQGLPPDVQQRYDKLTAKRRAETLTPEEHQELLYSCALELQHHLIYTKGKLVREAGAETYSFLISSKRAI